MPKSGGEKALTKHLPDEVTKLNISLEDANRIIAENIKILEASNLNVCGTQIDSNVNMLHQIRSKSPVIKNKTRIGSLKTRLGKALHKLYDLEPDAAPEKPLNLDLGVDLYQMEKF